MRPPSFLRASILQRAVLHPRISPPSCTAQFRRLSLTPRRFKDKDGNKDNKGQLLKEQQQQQRQWSTPLAQRLYEAISTTGSVPLASYMRMCLTGDLGGYYTGAIKGDRDQFGSAGDFVTSPEISQMFGDLVGLWFYTQWLSQGKPSGGVQFIEVGPGRGTLMDDILRVFRHFPDMAKSIEAVYMVEASRELREIQKARLCRPDPDAQTAESSVGLGLSCASKHGDYPIVWADRIEAIPIEPDKMPFIIAHEFFDALPIHVFQSAIASSPPPPSSPSPSPSDAPAAPSHEGAATPETTEWREMMVCAAPPPLRDSPDPGSELEFQLVLSSSTTRHSRHLPETSPRYRKLKTSPGSIVEICPDASIYASDFAARIGGSTRHPKPAASGAALIFDYGPSHTVPRNSLRGIRHHRYVSPFSEPGLVDLSADVDFTAIAEAATQASEGVEVYGPVTQGDFLEGMCIRDRAAALKGARGATESSVKNIDLALERLVDRGVDGMGKVYKVMAILPESGGRKVPVGFGGQVV